jgi:hypothetical protein
MPSYKVAHLREQGQDMIIVPLDSSFGRQSSSDQNAFMSDFQVRAASAGLRGGVAAVWNGGFWAPNPWHPFFRSFSVRQAQANINKEISW